MDSQVRLRDQLDRAISARADLLDSRREGALRLFNGFLEGCPELVIDLYARTAIIFSYANQPEVSLSNVQSASEALTSSLPWIQTVLLKNSFGRDDQARRGQIILGDSIDRKVREGGVWYTLDLVMNSDASLYLDTRNLRLWAMKHMNGKTVLNTFAYTCSLGVAAYAGGASRVIHLDRNKKYLNIGKDSYTLNGFPIARKDFIAADFFTHTSRLRKEGTTFDCIFLDPPFFSQTSQGRVDLNIQIDRLINKVRPLVNEGGALVIVNNALFVSGQSFLQSLESLSRDGYISIESMIPVPPDFTGFPETRRGQPPTDPAPFNHSTKICVLRVRRKTSS